LYETKGDKANAMKYYQKAVDLWAHADPSLNARVAALRAKIATLGGKATK
jgi:hypothetical protein